MIGDKRSLNPVSDSLTLEMETFNHEFKSSLTTIKIFTELLQKQLLKTSASNSNDNLNKIITKLDYLESLINDYADIIRIKSNNMDFKDKPYLSSRIVSNFLKKIKINFKDVVIKKSDLDNKKIKVDKKRLYQAIEKIILFFQKVYPEQKLLVQFKSNSSFLIFNFYINNQDYFNFFDPHNISKKDLEVYTAKEDLRIGIILASEIVKHAKGEFFVVYKKDKKLLCCFTLPLID